MQKRRFPTYGIAALVLCLAAWICSWLHIEPFSRYSFFPLWFGYILFIDALVVLRKGTSLLVRSGWRFVLLFLASSCFWWIFEGFNTLIHNWDYQLDQSYSLLAFIIIGTLDFSMVLPAILETAELLVTFPLLRPRLSATYSSPHLPPWILTLVAILGLASIILIWLFPHYCFPLIWLCFLFLLDPLNNLLGRKSCLAHIAARNWRFLALPLAGLICGFLWEMWNYYALPKWHYDVPYINFWKIFEMPLLGYSGYLPFALELFAMYQFVLLLIRQRDDYLSF
jgi:hypothetical protein